MITPAVTSAPGKAVICGEYAVLDGAPALSMALDRRARVTLAASPDTACRVAAPGHAEREGRFVIEAGLVRWLDGPHEEFAVLDAVCEVLRPDPGGALSLTLDSRAFRDPVSGVKLGIGSSAAITVALTAALAPSGAELLQAARAAHSLLQGGAGSGVDVASAVYGGLIRYRRDAPRPEPLPWPTGLHYVFLSSGVPASTDARLRRLQQGAVHPSRQELGTAAEAVARVWDGGSAKAILAALAEFTECLQRFGIDHGLGIFEAGHAELAAAAGNDIVYKPCGAGGGDLGVALATDAGALSAFVRQAGSFGFAPLPATLDTRGVEGK